VRLWALPGSFNAKCVQARNGISIPFFDIIDTGGAWSFTQARPQSRQLIPGSHGENFHCTVWIVANPSGDAKNVSFPFYEPAEANTLHASAH